MKLYLALCIAYINIWLIFANFFYLHGQMQTSYLLFAAEVCQIYGINGDPYLVRIKFYTTQITFEPDEYLYGTCMARIKV